MKNLKRKLLKRWVHLLDILHISRPSNFFEVPIIINNRNRLSTLRQLIAGLEQRGYHNIWIIDNHSSYPPLLEWMDKYQSTYHFVCLAQNVGHLSLFETGLYKRFCRGYYVYTDSDIVLPDSVPANFVERLWAVMQRLPAMEKCGCALHIDDLPDSFANKQQVLEWEQKFWQERIDDCEEVYRGG